VTVQLPVSVLGEGGIEIDVTALDAETVGEGAEKGTSTTETMAETEE